jgi:hypothetical protein
MNAASSAASGKRGSVFGSLFSPSSGQSSTFNSQYHTDMSILSSDHKILDGRFLKLGHVLKNWKSRRYVILSRQLQHFDTQETETMSHPAIKSESASAQRQIDQLKTKRVPLLLYFDKDTDTIAKGILALTEVKFSLEKFGAVKAIAQSSHGLLDDGKFV